MMVTSPADLTWPTRRFNRRSSPTSQRRGNLSEGSGGSRVEWDRIKVGLGLLRIRLTSRPLLIVAGDQRANGEFGQGHGSDEGLGGQQGGIRQAR